MSRGKREDTKQETRLALIAAGAAEFTEKGIEGTSLDAICERAGFTRGAFYVHFKDRDDLLFAILDLILGSFNDALFASADQSSLEQTVSLWVAAMIAGTPATRSIGRWQFHNTLAACARNATLRERYLGLQRRAIEQVATAARNSQRTGEVRDDIEAEPLAEILVILTMGISVMRDLGYPLDVARGGKVISTLVRGTKPKRRSK